MLERVEFVGPYTKIFVIVRNFLLSPNQEPTIIYMNKVQSTTLDNIKNKNLNKTQSLQVSC